MIKYNSITAFYGGTFDPIHYGHLSSVTSLLQFINFNKIFFMPNNIPPHRLQPIASSIQRLEMVRLAIIELANKLFIVNKYEIFRPGPSWIIDTFKNIRYIYGNNEPLAFILGQDSLLNLPKWKDGLELLDLCHLLVSRRLGYDNIITSENDIYWLTSRLTNNYKNLYKQPYGLIYCADTPYFNITASNIRSLYQKGHSCKSFLPYSVQNYIDKYSLYR